MDNGRLRHGKYSIPTLERRSIKKYYKSQESYSTSYSTKPVLTTKDGSTGTDRFFVLKLNDEPGGGGTFYRNGRANGSKITSLLKQEFGTGKNNTDSVYNLWKNSGAGAQDGSDIWNRLGSRGNWFIPSAGEWGALMDALGNSASVRNCFGLNRR